MNGRLGRVALFPVVALALVAFGPPCRAAPVLRGLLALPGEGRLYHGVFPGGRSGEEDDLTPADVQSYERLAGKPAAWVYFSHNWHKGRSFPLATLSWIRERGSVPFVRLMLRSGFEQDRPEKTFGLNRILDGELDADLRAWARGAREFGTPLWVEYGTEVNGRWFPWNGWWNGRGGKRGYGDPAVPDGPERFRDAYRHIVQIMRREGAGNLLWVFHVNCGDVPQEPWNRLEAYYPGDEWVDCLGVSVYGAQTPMEEQWPAFGELLDPAYARLAALSPAKPILLLEFGAARGNPRGDQAAWAEQALADLVRSRWPRVIGFAWWNEGWQNDDNPAHDTSFRLQDNPSLAAVFQKWIGSRSSVLGRIPRP